jgi:hypothetical protein
MNTHARRLAPAVSPLALALVAGDGGRAADDPRPVSGRLVLVRIEPDELTKYLHGVIREELKAPLPNERAVTKVRATALLIASRAQNGRGARDPGQRAALRDNALKVQKALAEKNLGAARRHADTLLDLSGLPADTRPVPLKDLMDLDEVERLMKLRRVGGLGVGPAPGAGPAHIDGIELKVISLNSNVPTPAELDAQAADLARAAAVTAAMAELLDVYAPAKKVGDKDPKFWKSRTDEMRAGASDLETAAKAKDAKRVRAAAVRLFKSCSECHEVFRD